MLDEPRFCALWNRLGCRGDCAALFSELRSAYSHPERSYHTVAHIGDCLWQLDLAHNLAERPDEVEAAIWFHDAVYDPSASDNEERSADWAKRSLAEGEAEADLAERVATLVMLTRHVNPPNSIDGVLLLDIDLSILGREPDVFVAYDMQIREEYRWVPELEYRRRRAEILKKFLGRAFIFRTDFFRDRFELQARRNLEGAIGLLRQ